MALFSRGEKSPKQAPIPQEETHPIVGKEAYCRICDSDQQFTRCWHRVRMMRECPCCQFLFEDPRAYYALFQPACPKCGEYLEQPDFEYGLCDGCGSKFEIMDGSRPCLIPNRQQRAEMDQHGKAKRID